MRIQFSVASLLALSFGAWQGTPAIASETALPEASLCGKTFPTLGLVVRGTERADHITLDLSDPDKVHLEINGRYVARDTRGPVAVYGLGGDDVIRVAAAGASQHRVMLVGGEGNDKLEGGARHDCLDGGLGNDLLIDRSPSGRQDRLIAGGGADTLVARPSRQRLADAQDLCANALHTQLAPCVKPTRFAARR